MSHRLSSLWQSGKRDVATMISAAFLVTAAALAAIGGRACALEAPALAVPYPTNLIYYVASGRAQQLDLYKAAGVGSHPLVVYFHGGGWVSGSRKDAMPLVSSFLARGFDVAKSYVSHAYADVVSVHRDLNTIVPFSQSVHPNSGLKRSRVSNVLIRVRGGGHGDFTEHQWGSIFDQVM